ncbi:UDP-N-acetylmuramate dehydrogenase [Patescibacteria group bacterium]
MINIQKNVPLAQYTTFRIGGSAKYFVEANNIEELKEALDHAKSNNLDFFVMGGGSNLLVSDKGFPGLIIKVKLNDFRIVGNSVEAESGVALAKVVNSSIGENLSGMEWAAGIPGTVGGAVRGNAGAYGKTTGDVAENVKALFLENMEIREMDNKDCKFCYRGSFFKKNSDVIILSARFNLEKGNMEKSQQEIKERIMQRISGQPKGVGNAGSFFLNPVVNDKKLRDEFEKDTGKKPKDEKLPAGWFVAKTGLQGKKIGGAMVSEEHANYIVNTSDATAEDVMILASSIKQKVRDDFGVQLTEEVQMLGF